VSEPEYEDVRPHEGEEEKHPIARMLLIGLIASAIGVALTLWMDWFPTPASDSAHDVDTLYNVLLIFSVPIFVLVMTIAIYSVWKFRARPGDMRDGAPIHGHTRLEIVWVTIPFLIVTGLAIYGWIVLDDIEAKQPREMTVNVTGQQFTWTFEYPQGGGAKPIRSTRLVLPKDRPVVFRIRTRDVIHSFWVPQFRLKSDAVPGLTTHVRLTPDRVGNYEVVCAELCGLGHSTMRQAVQVVPEQDFTAWLDKQKAAAGGAAPQGGGGGGGAQAVAQGKQVFQSAGCGACHTLKDAGASGTVGPDLDNLAAQAGKLVKGLSAEQYVKQSIEDPNAYVVKGFPKGVMPQDFKQQLSAQEIDALVKYLLTTTEGGGK
jgi:cytochrome c oxidase subunit II